MNSTFWKPPSEIERNDPDDGGDWSYEEEFSLDAYVIWSSDEDFEKGSIYCRAPLHTPDVPTTTTPVCVMVCPTESQTTITSRQVLSSTPQAETVQSLGGITEAGYETPERRSDDTTEAYGAASIGYFFLLFVALEVLFIVFLDFSNLIGSFRYSRESIRQRLQSAHASCATIYENCRLPAASIEVSHLWIGQISQYEMEISS